MLIKGTPSMLAPPTNPLGFSGLSLSGSLGYVDTTARPAYGGTSAWEEFQGDLFFGDRANRTAAGHPANIFGSYYDPAAWGSVGTVQLHQRDLMAHWKRILSAFPGSTWNDVALAYGVPESTIAEFAAGANASAFPIIRAVWTNPFVGDDIKRPALGLIVQRFNLTPWEWAGVVGLDEATAAQIVAVPVPPVARTSFMGVTPAVQATPGAPGFVVDTRAGAVGVIPAGSEPFEDAAFAPGDNVGGATGFRLTYPGDLVVTIPSNSPPFNVPIKPDLWAQVQDLFAKHLAQPQEGFDRRMAGIAQKNGWSEEDLAAVLGLTVPKLREFIDFRGGVMNIPEARQVITATDLPELVAPSEMALEPVQRVFYFDLPVGFETAPAAAKAAFYLTKIDAGFTDAQIRITAESAFGPQADADWGALRNLAAAQRAAEIAAKAAADAAAAAAAAQDQANAIVAADPQSSAAATTTQQAIQVTQAATTANDAAQAAATAAANAADAADAGDTAGVASASTVAITASDTATNATSNLQKLIDYGLVEPPYEEPRKPVMPDMGIEYERGRVIDRPVVGKEVTPSAAGGGVAPLLVAVAAAYILGA